MGLDHPGKLFVMFEPLPAKRCRPVVEELAGPRFGAVVPELAEALLQDIGSIEAFVGLEQQGQGLFSLEAEVFTAGQQVVLLALDKLSLGAAQPGIFALSNGIQCLAQVTHHVELVVKDGGPGCIGPGGVVERLPHVHHCQLDPAAPLGSQPLVESVQALL